eukprot:gene7526-13307_t
MYRNDVKKVRFFRDGDANFSGVSIAISRNRYRNFDSLLNDLSRKVPLPFGVRTLHTPGGVHHVYDIDQIEDGKDYVCSTFHSRPIKRLNYAGTSHKASWKPTPRKSDVFYKNEKQNEPSEKLFQTRNLKPKSITVIAKDDSSNRARVILNRRTAITYESVLQTVSDILQLNNGPVKDLFTIEGKKVGGIADLIHGPDVFVAASRSSGTVSARSMPSRLVKSKKTNSGPLQVSSNSQSKSAAGPTRRDKASVKKSPYTQPVFAKKKESKAKGNLFIFTVKTSALEDAGTKGKVAVVVCGSKGSTGELTLGPPTSKCFQPESNEEFEINVGNIGKVKKIRVMHYAENDDDTGWHLDEILMTSLARSSEEYLFQCNQWFSKKDEGDVTLLELPAIVKNKPVAKVVDYEITVMTGESPSAGTDANVFVVIYGDAGDTGKRWLKNSKSFGEPFAKGNIDVFDVNAVSLGTLTKILVGHDSEGNTPGWFLEKIIVKDPEEGKEYSFPCRRYLDEDIGDGKTEITIKASVVSDTQLTPEQLWKTSKWKFEDSNELTLVSVANGNVLRIEESTGECVADEQEPENSIFNVAKGGESSSRVFTVRTKDHDFNMTLDDGTVSGRKGNPGLLSEFYVIVAEDNSVTLESVVHKGVFVSISEEGKAQPGDSSLGKSNKFNIYGTFRNLGRVRIRPFLKNQAVIEENENLYGDGEPEDERGEFVVHKTGSGTRAFQSAVTDKFVSVTASEICCRGEDKNDEECQFRVHKDRKRGVFRFESVKMPGVFFGISATGRVKHAVDAGDSIASLSVDIVSLGERRQATTPDNEHEDVERQVSSDVEQASRRGSTASHRSKEEDPGYKDDEFENEDSRSISRESGSRASTRASSRRSSAASSRRDSGASKKSRSTSRRTASRSGSAMSRKSSAGKEEEEKEKHSEEDENNDDDGKDAGSRPGTAKSNAEDYYKSEDDGFENDSENERDENKPESEEKDDESGEYKESNGSRKSSVEHSSPEEDKNHSGDEGDNDKAERGAGEEEVKSEKDAEVPENSTRAASVSSRKSSSHDREEDDQNLPEKSSSRPQSTASKSQSRPTSAKGNERPTSTSSTKDEESKEGEEGTGDKNEDLLGQEDDFKKWSSRSPSRNSMGEDAGPASRPGSHRSLRDAREDSNDKDGKLSRPGSNTSLKSTEDKEDGGDDKASVHDDDLGEQKEDIGDDPENVGANSLKDENENEDKPNVKDEEDANEQKNTSKEEEEIETGPQPQSIEGGKEKEEEEANGNEDGEKHEDGKNGEDQQQGVKEATGAADKEGEEGIEDEKKHEDDKNDEDQQGVKEAADAANKEGEEGNEDEEKHEDGKNGEDQQQGVKEATGAADKEGEEGIEDEKKHEDDKNDEDQQGVKEAADAANKEGEEGNEDEEKHEDGKNGEDQQQGVKEATGAADKEGEEGIEDEKKHDDDKNDEDQQGVKEAGEAADKEGEEVKPSDNTGQLGEDTDGNIENESKENEESESKNDSTAETVENKPGEEGNKDIDNKDSGRISRENSTASLKNGVSRKGSSKADSRPSSQKSKAGVYEGLIRGQSPPHSREGSASSLRGKRSSSRGSNNSAKRKEKNDASKVEISNKPASPDLVEQSKEEDVKEDNKEDNKESNAEKPNIEKEDARDKKEANENDNVNEEDESVKNVDKENDKIEDKEGGKKDEETPEKEDDSANGTDEKKNESKDIKEDQEVNGVASDGNEPSAGDGNEIETKSNEKEEKESNEAEKPMVQSETKEEDSAEEKGKEGEVGDNEEEQQNENEGNELGKSDDSGGTVEEKTKDEKNDDGISQNSQDEDVLNLNENNEGSEEAQGDKSSNDENKDQTSDANKPDDKDKDSSAQNEKTGDGLVEGEAANHEKKDDGNVNSENGKEGVSDPNKEEERKKDDGINEGNNPKDEIEQNKDGSDGQPVSKEAADESQNDKEDQVTNSDEGRKSGTNTPTSLPASKNQTAANSPILSPTPPKTPRNSLSARRPSSRLSNPSGSKADLRSSTKPSNATEVKDEEHAEDLNDSVGKENAEVKDEEKAEDLNNSKDKDSAEEKSEGKEAESNDSNDINKKAVNEENERMEEGKEDKESSNEGDAGNKTEDAEQKGTDKETDGDSGRSLENDSKNAESSVEHEKDAVLNDNKGEKGDAKETDGNRDNAIENTKKDDISKGASNVTDETPQDGASEETKN